MYVSVETVFYLDHLVSRASPKLCNTFFELLFKVSVLFYRTRTRILFSTVGERVRVCILKRVRVLFLILKRIRVLFLSDAY
jgi:hypothetical protein